MDLKNPTAGAEFIVNWKNKLDIDDCDLYHMSEA